jgi:hypothetical protein
VFTQRRKGSKELLLSFAIFANFASLREHIPFLRLFAIKCRSIPKISRSVTDLNVSVKSLRILSLQPHQGLPKQSPGGERLLPQNLSEEI